MVWVLYEGNIFIKKLKKVVEQPTRFDKCAVYNDCHLPKFENGEHEPHLS